jgi:hypothetical protein
MSRSGGPPDPRDRSTPAGCPPSRWTSWSVPTGSSRTVGAGEQFWDLKLLIRAHCRGPGEAPARLGIPGLSMLYPGGCPQPWIEVDTGGALIGRGSCAYAVGDLGRLVEKLSPGMCTGWGDLVAAGSPEVTARPIQGRRRWDQNYPADTPGHVADLRVCARQPASARGNPEPCRSGTRTGCARPGDPAGRHRGQQVDGGRSRCTTVEMSTSRHRRDADHPQSANRPIQRLSSGKGPDPQLPHL